MSHYEEYKEINEQILQKIDELEQIDGKIEIFKKASAMLVRPQNLSELG